jgi:RNA-directed DNA polymerase
MVRIFTSFIFGVTIVPSPCSMSVQAIPRQPSSHARAKPTGPPPTIRTGLFYIEEKLKDLHDKVHRGSYRARPARRTYIPKADGSKRPLSILCLEDKIVQQAVATVLEAIYEEDFLGLSYGFRPGRGQHDALDALHAAILRKQVNWVLDADIRGFFDAMAHSWIIRFLEHRIADKRILRLIAKWLKVGIVEDGRRTRGVCGAPQGAVISPILANVYLHYVFDLWVHRWRLTKASGDMIVIRYEGDCVVTITSAGRFSPLVP